MQVFFSPKYTVEMGDHVFPTVKFALTAERLVTEGVLARRDLVAPPPAPRPDLLLAHTPEWVDKVLEGRLTARDSELLELPWSPELALAHRIAVSGTTLACREALATGLGLHVGGGSHHAMPDHGEGFCVFNDLAVAALAMLRERRIRRAAVVDLDVHQGNGTAAIFPPPTGLSGSPISPPPVGGRGGGEGSVFTFSIHQQANYPLVKPPSTLDIGVPDGTADEEYLRLLRDALPRFLDHHRPNLVVYQAGADCFEQDLLGGLKLTKAGLQERDRTVFQECFRRRLPVAVTLGGGYAARLADTVAIHAATLRLGIECHGRAWQKRI